VELALALPFVCLLLLGALDVAVIGADQVLVIHAAREGARAAAAALDDASASSAAVAAARQAFGTDADHLELDVRRRGGDYEVAARYRARPPAGPLERIVPAITLHATVVMRAER